MTLPFTNTDLLDKDGNDKAGEEVRKQVGRFKLRTEVTQEEVEDS